VSNIIKIMYPNNTEKFLQRCRNTTLKQLKLLQLSIIN